MTIKNLLLLDLDGTVRQPKSDSEFINDPSDQKLIDGAKEAIDRYYAEGWIIVGISNQGGVVAGHKSTSNCFKEQLLTLELAEHMRRIYFCPDEGKTCWMVARSPLISRIAIPTKSKNVHKKHPAKNYRKPGTGMLDVAIDWFWNRHYPELSDSLLTGLDANFAVSEKVFDVLYIGDRPEDEQAARSAGVRFMWADQWRNQPLI